MFAKLSLLAFLTLIVTAAIVMAAEQGAPSRAAPAQPPLPRAPEIHRHLSNAAVDQGPTRADIPADLPPDLKALIEKTFSTNAVERGKAADALGAMQQRAVPAIPFLIRLLDDDATVRFLVEDVAVFPVTVATDASVAISGMGAGAVEPCIAALKQHIGTARGNELIRILGDMKDPRAVEPMIALLGHRDSLVRVTVVRSLHSWKDPRFVPPLIGALKDQDEEVRVSATRVLKELHDPRLVQPLVDALKDKVVNVRQHAAKALGAQRDVRAVPALLRVLHDAAEDSGVRYAAACALGEIGEARSLDDLLAVFKNRSLPDDVRSSAADGLALSKDRRFVEPLLAIAKDGKEASDFRGDIVEAIADLDGSRAIPFLTEIATTKNEDDHVQCRAALCVVKLTEGAVDDVGIVAALQGRYRIEGDKSIHGVIVASEVLEKAALAVAEHGKTEAVRAAAAALLKKWGKAVSPSANNTDQPSPDVKDAPSPREK